MKKLLTILSFIFSIASFGQGAFQANGRFAPTGNYFITVFGESQTGYYPVARYTQRDSLPLWQRTYGMVVYAADRDSCYQLKSWSLDNSNWYAYKLGSVSLAGYLQASYNLSDVTNTATARANLSVYSKSEVDAKTISGIALGNSLYQLNFGYGFGSSTPYNGSGIVNQTIDTTKIIPYTDTLKSNGVTTQWWVKQQGYLTVNQTITITGDATGSGTTSIAITLATVNTNTGSWGTASSVASFTVNGKGLITAASNISIQITESQVTNLSTDLAAKLSATITSASSGQLIRYNGSAWVNWIPNYLTSYTETDPIYIASSWYTTTNNASNWNSAYTYRVQSYSSPLLISGNSISISQSSTSVDGYLSHADWNTFNGKQNALGYTAENTANKGAANGYAPLDGTIKIPTSYLPALAMNNVWVPTSQTAMLALSSAVVGDVAVRSDSSITYVLKSSDYTNPASWVKLLSPAAPVSSVNGQTGVVTLTTNNISESGNLYYLDSRARASISVSGSLSYNSTTGVISYTQPTNVSTFSNDAGYVTYASTGVFTNKTWNGVAIANSYLANSSVTVNGVAISLGSSGTVTAAAGTLTGTTLNSTVVSSSLTSVGTIGTGTWQGTAIADSYIASAATWNAKQAALSGTGFVKISGTTISYDNSTYLTTSSAATTYLGISATAANSTQWNGQSYIGANSSVSAVMTTNGSGYGYSTLAQIQSWLGLGSYAYRSSGLAELSGATFTGITTFSNTSGSISLTNQNSTTGIGLNIRPSSGKNGTLSFTEDAVSDRWAIGIKNGDGALYFNTGSSWVESGGFNVFKFSNLGLLTVNGNSNSASITLNRPSTSTSSAIVLSTSNSSDWFIGTNALGTNVNDFYLYKYSIGTVIDVSSSTGSITFGYSITGTSASFSDIVRVYGSADYGYALNVDGGSTKYAQVIHQGGTSAYVPLDIWHAATSGNNTLIHFSTEGTETSRGGIRYDRSGGRLEVYTEQNGLLFTGTSTFSSSVTANGTLSVNGYSFSSDFGAGYNVYTGIGVPATSPNKGINIGWNTTSDFAFIGAVQNGTAWKSLYLNPIGGDVYTGSSLHVGSNLTVTGTTTATTFYKSSDISYKENIVRYLSEDGIPYAEYDLKATGAHDFGVIAQDVEKVLPYAVTKNDQGKEQVSYETVLMYKIMKLEERIKQLENQKK